MIITETAAERIAGDLAVAIHQGHLQPGEQVPSQQQLMKAYGVAMATAASALAKLAAAGLTRADPGRGTFVMSRTLLALPSLNPVLQVLAAAEICRTMAARDYPPGVPATIEVGGHPDWNEPGVDDEKAWPPRTVDAGALHALDRHLLRWLSESLLSAARRLVSTGVTASDQHLIDAARAILADGGRRPDKQPPIAHYGGATPPDEDVALRIWPERARPFDPDGPPF